ncbi:hypothetical protein H2200_005527 [Cladophialophora chaetospira]|uniref:C3H1-type domain-containing protein n=1 Tax=Cladophialophora chaetospira TaxID=386627 RepID=A0AA38XC55_9EURO|nr:hypothetical protein H2200_005527 [Cladophialophora chaetospira]
MAPNKSHLASYPRNKFYTCRYWALGPACPNVDPFHTVVCEFAHYDTGVLASHVQQRGTCLPWKLWGYCGKGTGCWYEHRDTGVTGLYQGNVELSGFELEVADAATKAGFNTLRHEALFDLIWAVKRVATRGPGSQLRNRPPPPKDPIYPDRYRPSGIGDNTNKKRRAVTIQAPTNHDVELRFHPIKPLMRKRPLQATKQRKNKTSENIIDLTQDSDGEDLIDLSATPHSTAKRQKVVADDDKKPLPTLDPTAPTRVPGTNAAATTNYVPPSGASFEAQRKRGGRRGRTAQAIRSGNTSAMTNLPLTAANATPMLPRKPLTAEEGITKQLLLVKTKMEEATKNMNTCQATMKTLFDTHYGKFDNDDTMMALQKLSNHMNKVYDGGNDGAGEIDKAIALLNDNKNDIL